MTHHARWVQNTTIATMADLNIAKPIINAETLPLLVDNRTICWLPSAHALTCINVIRPIARRQYVYAISTAHGAHAEDIYLRVPG